MIRLYSLKFLFVALGFLSISTLVAQEDYIEEDTLIKINLAEIGLEYVIPQSIFGDRVNTSGIGASATYLRQQKAGGPIFIGADIYWHSYYATSITFQELLDGFLEDLTQKSRTSIAGTDLILRYYPFLSPLLEDVYVEGMLGGKYVLTTTAISIAATAETLDFDLDNAKLSASYGGSIGAQFHIYDYRIFLNTKFTYLKGTSAGFYAIPEGVDNIDLTIDQLDYRNAPIDILRLQLGVTFAF